MILCSLVLALASPQELDIRGLLVPGEEIEAEIGGETPVVRTPALDAGFTATPTVGATYALVVEQAGTYHVDLRSYDFDAYLVLRHSDGEIVAENDDGMVYVHASLVAELEGDVEYWLTACALHGARGEFTLELVSGAPVPISRAERTRLGFEEGRAELAHRESKFGFDSLEVVASLNRLAVLFGEAGDHGQAKHFYERALAIYDAQLPPDHPDVASAANNLGLAFKRMGDYGKARPLYERALAIREAQPDPESADTAWTLSDLASLLMNTGEHALAKELLERSLAIREKRLGPSHFMTSVSLNALGLLHDTLGNFSQAKSLLERSLEIRLLRRGPDHVRTGTALNNLGNLFLGMREFRESKANFERALVIFEAHYGPDHPELVPVLSNLGILHLILGDYARAIPLSERAHAICEARLGPDHLYTGKTLGDLGEALHQLGDKDQALQLLERSLRIIEARLGPHHLEVATALIRLARVVRIVRGQAPAIALYERALAISEAHPDSGRNEVIQSMKGLASSLHSTGRLEEARQLIERALAMGEEKFGIDHPHVASDLNNLGVLLGDMGDLEQAKLLHERSFAIIEAQMGLAHPEVALSMVNLALLYMNLRETDKAWDLLRRSQGAMRSELARILISRTSKESRFYLSHRLRQQEIFLSLARITGDPEIETAAASSLLAWKGQVGRVARSQRRLARESDEARGVSTHLRQRQAELSRLAYNTEMRPETRARRIEVVRREIATLDVELRELLGLDELDAMDIDAVREHVPKDAVLLSFFVHKIYELALPGSGRRGRWSRDHLVAWVIRHGSGVVSVDLGPAEAIEEQTREFLGRIRGAVPAAARGEPLSQKGTDPGTVLREMLWDPLLEHLGEAPLVIVSHDRFTATLPFEVLVGRDGRYLIEDRSFVYLHDLQSLAEFEDGAAPEYDSLFCAGGVDFDDRSEPAAPLLVALRGEGDAPTERWRTWSPLGATDSEVRTIQDLHESFVRDGSRTLVMGMEATEERVLAEMPEASLVHLATHGFFRPEGLPSMLQAAREEADRKREGGFMQESEGLLATDRKLAGYLPEVLSGLVFAGANLQREDGRLDGYLTAADVDWMDLSGVELVTLSACETGLGRSESGEGMSGFRTTLLRAGAKTVVSSLWQVPDDSTGRLMGRFYENLLRHKQGKLEALRGAQLWMLAENRRKYDGEGRPHSWGAFALSGDWH